MVDLSRVPHNLRRFVVEQDYAEYTEIDQAVWRFVLLQTYERLARTAHPAYAQGLGRAGISVERIPHIEEMSACLERFGWSAVCVDGFIAPRAFQEFQAASILPIAADMRTKEHLVYTPAPDIIHEAAGHAPILPDVRYAAYLREIGEVGKKAFSSPEDARVYAAIFELSEVKETPGVSAAAITAAETRLSRALDQVTETSEASRISRLYWWTAEYGLVGTPRDYKLYGAGLLSSLWESHACHDITVKKLALGADCVEQAYDITRTQPQLYVARDFEHLFAVLHEVEAKLVHRTGGDAALQAAVKSEEVATLRLPHDGFAVGEVASVQGGSRRGVVTLRGRVGLGVADAAFEIFEAPSEGYRVPIGPLTDGALLSSLTESELRARAKGRRLHLGFAGGVELSGNLARTIPNARGGTALVELEDYELRSSSGTGFCERGARRWLCAADEVLTAHAGSANPEFFPESTPSSVRVPKPRTFAERERALLALYDRAIAAFRGHAGSGVVSGFLPIVADLDREFSEEWLLRWNLLECLVKLGEQGPLAVSLETALARLEVRFSHREPIATGLRYLSSLAA